MSVRSTTLTFTLLVALLSRKAAASPEDMFGYGPESPGLAGLGAATSKRYDATYTNPALLSRLRERELGLGFTGGTFRLSPDAARGSLSVRGMSIGVGLPVPLGGIVKDRVAFGMAFYTPPDAIVRARILYPEKPSFPLFADRAQSLAARLGVGVDVGYGVRLGAGFATTAELVGIARVATDASGRVGSQIEDQLVAAYAPTFGASFEHRLKKRGRDPGTLRVGLTVRGTLEARFAVEIDAQKLSTLNIPIFNIAGVAQYDPWQIVLEGAYETRRGFLTAGFTYKGWSAYPGVIEPTIRCPADNPECAALKPAKIAFSNTLVPRLGGEWWSDLSPAVRLKLRGGYSFEPTPTPSSLPASIRAEGDGTVDVPTRFFDASRHLFAVGSGFDLFRDGLKEGRLTLDWYAQVHLLHGRDVVLAPTREVVSVRGVAWISGFFAGVKF